MLKLRMRVILMANVHKGYSEHDEQTLLFMWASYHPILSKYLLAIPNGGQRDVRVARKLKAEGVKRGVSDIFLAYPVEPYHGCWIEMKRCKPQKSYLTIDQKIWLNQMKNLGYQAQCAYGYEEAKGIILDYLTEAS